MTAVKYNSKPNKWKSKTISFRLREDLFIMFNKILQVTGIDKRIFIEMAILEKMVKFDVDFKIDGIDFKKYCEVVRLEFLRRFHGTMRNEILSRALFMNRVRTDLYKLMLANSSIAEIKKYITNRKDEASNYTDNEDLLKEIEDYENMNSVKYKELKRILKTKIEMSSYKDLEIKKNKYTRALFLEDKTQNPK